MPILAELYVAARTRNVEDADTDDLPVLVVRRGSNIVFTKPLFGGSSRVARGKGAVWRFDVREVNLDSADLTFELHASDDDAWSPEHVIVWGINGRVGDERVIPLAAFLDLATPLTPADGGVWISTDTSEGRAHPLHSFRRSRAGRDACAARYCHRRDGSVRRDVSRFRGTANRLQPNRNRARPSSFREAEPGGCFSITRSPPHA